MAILYGLVARGSVILAEFSGTSTNANTIARQILEKLPGNDDSHVSYSQDRYIFHVKRTDGLTVLCMADDSAGRRIPFAFLEDIHGRFVKTYGRTVFSALPYAMNDEFSRILSQQIEYYSNDPNADRINRLKGEMSQVRGVMIENIDKVLERGDRLEVLVDKADHMQGSTVRFRKQARRFKNTVWWRNVKLTDSLMRGGKSNYMEHSMRRVTSLTQEIRFHYADDFHADLEIKDRLNTVIKRLCDTKEKRILVDKQLDVFSGEGGLFGDEMAKNTRESKQPALWWNRYGDYSGAPRHCHKGVKCNM